MSESINAGAALDQFADLAAAHPGQANYDAMDRYRDFRAVFLASDQGKRVLHEILSFGHVFRSGPALARFEANKTFFHEGERNLALRILTTINQEPVPKHER